MASLTYLIVFCLVVLMTSQTEGVLTAYGNNITERTGDPTFPIVTGINPGVIGPRIWIDDFQPMSWPSWGFLYTYMIYITDQVSGPMPTLYLQIWTNTTQIDNYVLKWQIPFSNYAPGAAYNVSPPTGSVIEVTQYDRIGFTSTGSTFNPVAWTQEFDNAAMTSAHRTYWVNLTTYNNTLAQPGNQRLMDNAALRSTFSIGIVLSSNPPTTATQTYCGNLLQITSTTLGTQSGSDAVYLDLTFSLVPGQVVQFFFNVAPISVSTVITLMIWLPTDSAVNSAQLIWMQNVTLNPGPSQVYNIPLSNGPIVTANHRVGWMFTGENPLYTLQNFQAKFTTITVPSGFPVLQNIYSTATPLSNFYANSIGVVVDSQYTTPTTTTPMPVTQSTSSIARSSSISSSGGSSGSSTTSSRASGVTSSSSSMAASSRISSSSTTLSPSGIGGSGTGGSSSGGTGGSGSPSGSPSGSGSSSGNGGSSTGSSGGSGSTGSSNNKGSGSAGNPNGLGGLDAGSGGVKGNNSGISPRTLITQTTGIILSCWMLQFLLQHLHNIS